MKRKHALFFVVFYFAFFALLTIVFFANLDGPVSVSRVYAPYPEETETNGIDQLSPVDATNLFGTIAGPRIGKRFPAPPGRYLDILYFEKGLRPLPAPWPYTREQARAIKHGARSKITFRVVDSFEKPVPNATVHVLYYFRDAPYDSKDYVTDENGLVVVSHRKSQLFYLSIEKEGYWDSHFRLIQFEEGYDCVRDGRFLPWNPTVEVELRNKIHPVKMEWRRFEGDIPLDEWIPFDMEKAMPAFPYGNGSQTNLFLREEIVVSNRVYRMNVQFPKKYGHETKRKEFISLLRRSHAIDQTALKENARLLTSIDSTTEEDSGVDIGIDSFSYMQFCYPMQRPDGTRSFRCGFTTIPFVAWHDKSGQRGNVLLEYWVSTVPGDTSIEPTLIIP